jgi:hypothetical protein
MTGLLADFVQPRRVLDRHDRVVVVVVVGSGLAYGREQVA